VLGTTDVKVQSLVSIEPGDVIVLDRRLGEPLDIRLNDAVRLRGHPGIARGKYAVKLITEE
jgi:flagellar motor switch/type III secretory pathway protein FliN